MAATELKNNGTLEVKGSRTFESALPTCPVGNIHVNRVSMEESDGHGLGGPFASLRLYGES